MIWLAILFMLLATIVLGWKVGAGVQDEVVPAKRYLQFGIALTVVLLTFLVMSKIVAMPWAIGLCLCTGALILISRWHAWIVLAVAGVLVGLAASVPIQTRVQAVVFCLLANYLQGAILKRKELLQSCLSFAAGAIAALLLVR